MKQLCYFLGTATCKSTENNEKRNMGLMRKKNISLKYFIFVAINYVVVFSP